MRSIPLALTFALGSLLVAGPVRAQVASVPDGELAVVHINGVASCSAFLVRPGTFLTAMHCAQLPGPDRVVVGVTIDADRGADAGTARRLTSSRVWTAPGTWTGDFDIDGHDFAVIQIEKPFAEAVPGVVPLKIYEGDPSSLVGEEVELIGFGFKNGAYARKRSESRIAEVGVTIAVKPAIACAGDSGGVLLLKKTREAIGIASREWPVGSNPCDDPAKVTGYRTPESSYFQRIDAHASLIDAPPDPAPSSDPKHGAAPEASSGGCSVGATTLSSSLGWLVVASAGLFGAALRRKQSR